MYGDSAPSGVTYFRETAMLAKRKVPMLEGNFEWYPLMSTSHLKLYDILISEFDAKGVTDRKQKVGPTVRLCVPGKGLLQNRKGWGRERLVVLGTSDIHFRLTPPFLLKYVF